MIVRNATFKSPPLKLIEKGRGYVAAEWGSTTCIACYAPPRWSLIEFTDYLERLGVIATNVAPRPLLVAGDLNTKSPAWGSPAESPRGETLREWVE